MEIRGPEILGPESGVQCRRTMPVEVPPVTPESVDRLDVTILVDNVSDAPLANTQVATRPRIELNRRRPSAPTWASLLAS